MLCRALSKGILGLLLLAVAGCAEPPLTAGTLGYGEGRRVVIVGENVEPAIADYYQKKYEAQTWFTPYEGKVANAAGNLLQSGFGSSVAMRMLMKELNSLNYTVGRWEIIIPKIAEGYFLATLKGMRPASLAKARGMIVLIDSSGNAAMEKEVQRATDGSFFVTYEFQK